MPHRILPNLESHARKRGSGEIGFIACFRSLSSRPQRNSGWATSKYGTAARGRDPPMAFLALDLSDAAGGGIASRDYRHVSPLVRFQPVPPYASASSLQSYLGCLLIHSFAHHNFILPYFFDRAGAEGTGYPTPGRSDICLHDAAAGKQKSDHACQHRRKPLKRSISMIKLYIILCLLSRRCFDNG
jgi:hypothetical protein